MECGGKDAKDKPATAVDTAAVAPDTATTFTDKRDGKVYRIVKIGSQTWFAENLNYAAGGSKCYENSEDRCAKYGRFYNWETALKACPAGFHLPTDGEWTALVDYAGGEETAGTKLKSTAGWNYYKGMSGNGTDDFGFSALPGGHGNSGGGFSRAGDDGSWWSATELSAILARIRYMYYSEAVSWFDYYKTYLFSVRCVADKEAKK